MLFVKQHEDYILSILFFPGNFLISKNNLFDYLDWVVDNALISSKIGLSICYSTNFSLHL